MRLLIAINRVCYGACLLAIISGAFLAVISIWTEHHDVGWKGVATTGVLVFAAVLVLATNSIIGTKVMDSAGGIEEFLPPKMAQARAAGLGTDAADGGESLASIVRERRDAREADDA